MTPEIAPTIVGSVALVAVRAPKWMRARLPRSGGGDRRGRVGVPLATSSERTMMLFAVRSRTGRAPDLGSATLLRGVTPSPAACAESGARVSPGSAERTDKSAKLDQSTQKRLGARAAHRVSDVKVNRSCVRHTGITYHPWQGGEDSKAGQTSP